jgi:hypothetical protein
LKSRVSEDIFKEIEDIDIFDLTEIDFDGIRRADVDKVADLADKVAESIADGNPGVRQIAYERIFNEAEEYERTKKIKEKIESDTETQDILSKYRTEALSEFESTNDDGIKYRAELVSTVDSINNNVQSRLNKLVLDYNSDVDLYKQELISQVQQGIITNKEANKRLKDYNTQLYSELESSNNLVIENNKKDIEEVSKEYYKKIEGGFSKFLLDNPMDPSDVENLQAAMKKIYEEVDEGEFAYLKAKENLQPLLFGRIGSTTSLVTSLGKSYYAELGRAIASKGTFFNQPWMTELGDEMMTAFSVADERVEDWSDLANVPAVVKSVGRLAGSATSSIAVGAIAGTATGGLGAIPAMAAVATASGLTESIDMAGNIKRDIIRETGSLLKGEQGAEAMWKAQMGNWWTYLFDGLPYVGKALRGVSSKVAKIGIVGLESSITETIQETRQTAQEQKIMESVMSGEEISARGFGELITPGLVKSTFLEVAPGSFFLGGSTRAVTEFMMDEKADKLAKEIIVKTRAGLVDNTDSFIRQKIFASMNQFGKNFTNSWLAILQKNGAITEEELGKLYTYSKTAEGFLRNVKGLNLTEEQMNTYFALSNRANELYDKAESITDDKVTRATFTEQANALKKNAQDFLNNPETGGSFVSVKIGKSPALIMNEEQAIEFVTNNPYVAFQEAGINIQGRNVDEFAKMFSEMVEGTKAGLADVKSIDEYSNQQREEAAPGEEAVEEAKLKDVETATQRLANRTKEQKDSFGDQHTDKKLPYGAADISDITTTDKNGVTTATYVNPETNSVDVIITATNEDNFVGYVRVYENGKPTDMFTAKMQASESGKFKNIITSAENALPDNAEVVETTTISTGGLKSYNKSRLVEKVDEDGNVVTRPTKYSDATKESVKEKGEAAYNPFKTTDKSAAEAEIAKIKEAYPGINTKIIEKKAPPLPPQPGKKPTETVSNQYTISIDLPVLIKSNTTQPTTSTSNQSEINGQAKKPQEGTVRDNTKEATKETILEERTDKDFANKNESYRVIVGDEAFNDIVESGTVKVGLNQEAKDNAKKAAETGGINLDRRGTTPSPSFSKGKADMMYAGNNSNHYIVVTEDQSMRPSTMARHGKGSTMFPTDENGKHLKELDGSKVKVYKHLGKGKYELVYANGKTVESITKTTKKETTTDTQEAVAEGLKAVTELSEEQISELNKFLGLDKSKRKASRKGRTKKDNQRLDKVERAVDLLKQSLSKVMPNIVISVAEDSDMFARFAGEQSDKKEDRSKGLFTRIDGIYVIVLNPDSADVTTVFHEGLHAVLRAAGLPSAQARAVTTRMVEAVKKTATKKLQRELEAFTDLYETPLKSQEYIAELTGILANNYNEQNNETKSIIRRWLQKLAEMLGLKPKGVSLSTVGLNNTDAATIDALNFVAKKMSEGGVLTEQDLTRLTQPGEEQQGDGSEETVTRKQKRKKPKNIKELLDVMEGVFGLNKTQSESVAVVGDVLVETMAKRAGVSKEEMYQIIAYAKAQKAPDGSLKQGSPLFKSTAKEGLSKIQQKAATPEQWVKMITDKGGKGTMQELEWIGLEDYLNKWNKENNAKSVPKEVVEQYINDNQIEIQEITKGDKKDSKGRNEIRSQVAWILIGKGKPVYDSNGNEVTENNFHEADSYFSDIDKGKVEGNPKWSDYTLEGGENYREVLLTLPKKKGQDYAEKMRNKYGKELGPMQIYEKMSESERETQAKLNNESEVAYKSKHWDESNILAHLRLNERTLPNGERVMFIEEVQSDWAQEGKKKGFISDLFRGNFREFVEKEKGLRLNEEELLAEFNNNQGELKKEFLERTDRAKTPDMPYKKTDQWVGMAMRRAMQMASQEGFDRVAWVTGEQSADRYDLSKSVDDIRYIKNEDGSFQINAFQRGGNVFSKNNMNEQDISDTLGKEIAEKIVNGVGEKIENETSISGEGLKVGGEGMKAFYNSILPKVAKKEAQRFDKKANVEVVEIDQTTTDKGKPQNEFTSNAVKDVLEGQKSKQLSIPITPEMRMNLNNAVPLFQGEQGAMLAEDGKYTIYALTNPNVSTPLHELAHVYEHYLTDKERADIESWSGHNAGTVEFSEAFARGFEKFLAGGKVKNPRLQKIFENFKKWLTEIYNGIKGSEIDIQLNSKMESIYNDMLGAEETPVEAPVKETVTRKQKKKKQKA